MMNRISAVLLAALFGCPASVWPASMGGPVPAAGGSAPGAQSVSESLPAPSGSSGGNPFESTRDPFLTPGSGAPRVTAKEPTEFSIHNLVLKGILRDPSGDFAILVEQGSGASYILRNGRLYNSRKKPVRGIAGIIQAKRKKVHLMTPEKDVQTFILGEAYKDKEGL